MLNTRVLMLGWENMPNFVGGLGVATDYIFRALQSQVRHLNYLSPSFDAQEFAPDDFADFSCLNEYLQKFSAGDTSLLSPYPNTSFAPYEQMLNSWLSLANQVSELIAKKHKPQIVHAHDWPTFPLALDIKRLTNAKLVVHLHSSQQDRDPAYGQNKDCLIDELEQKTLQAADHILVVSKQQAAQLCHQNAALATKISFVHHANTIFTDMNRFEQKKIKEKLVVFIGRFEHQKAPENFLEIATQTYLLYPNVRFAMAGTGSLLHTCIEKSAQTPIADRIHFTGFLDRVSIARLLSWADVLCMPSLHEPFGLVALEAASVGVPVVISQNSGVAEVLPGAFCVPEQNLALFSQYIAALLRFEQIQQHKSEQLKTQSEALDWNSAAQEIKEIYTKILKNK